MKHPQYRYSLTRCQLNYNVTHYAVIWYQLSCMNSSRNWEDKQKSAFCVLWPQQSWTCSAQLQPVPFSPDISLSVCPCWITTTANRLRKASATSGVQLISRKKNTCEVTRKNQRRKLERSKERESMKCESKEMTMTAEREGSRKRWREALRNCAAAGANQTITSVSVAQHFRLRMCWVKHLSLTSTLFSRGFAADCWQTF